MTSPAGILLRRLLQTDPAAWARLRQRGRRNFVWKQNVLGVGVPVAIVGTLTAHFVSGHTWRALWSLRTLVIFALTVGVTLAAFYVLAGATWTVNESRDQD
jgi:cytochrome bd-type quinol oxidase subunit 2